MELDDDRKAAAGAGRRDEQPDFLFLGWHLEQKLTDFIASGSPPELMLRCVLDRFASLLDRIATGRDDQPDYEAVALVLRARLTHFIDSRRLEDPELRGVLREAAMRRVISYDARMMNPGLWRNLPADLVEHVLARLPAVLR